jgi:predicted XRE-type DNA-binding protein
MESYMEPFINDTSTNASITIKEQVLSKALIKVSLNLGLNQNTLSKIIGVTKIKISQIFKGKVNLFLNTREGDSTLMLIRVYSILNVLLSDDERKCKKWFQSYNVHLQGIPKELCKTPTGLIKIVDYVEGFSLNLMCPREYSMRVKLNHSYTVNDDLRIPCIAGCQLPTLKGADVRRAASETNIGGMLDMNYARK